MPETIAKRGDAILVALTRSSFSLKGGPSNYTVYSFGTVANVDREGNAKKWIEAKHSIKDNVPVTRYIIGQSVVNVPALIAHVADGDWNSNEFTSLDEARDVARKFKL